MKKPTASNQTEKPAKRTPEEKKARKSAKETGRATADLSDDRADKKASQKKSLKSAAKLLQKELNSRMNEVVTRIRKETKDKLKEVVKEATRRLDSDTERMFEQALHTIVRHYDSVSANVGSSENGQAASQTPVKTAPKASKKGQKLNKDGSHRKTRTPREEASVPAAATVAAEAPAVKPRGRKPGAAAAKAQPIAARRGRAATAAASAAPAARRGPKPRVQAAPEVNDVTNSADSASTGEVSE